MSLRSLFNADAGLSLILHGLKAAVALFVNWLVLRHFAVADFVVWSVTSSVLVIATASDLGIGQYAVTRMINLDRRDWPAQVGESLGALIPLMAASVLFVFFAVRGPSVAYDLTMALLLGARILTIPFAGVLNAANQFKIRKAIELFAYLLAALGVAIIVSVGAEVHWALLTLNVTFLLGAILTVIAAHRYAPIGMSLGAISISRSVQVFRATTPFMVNNITGLLTYGGFIWLSSLVLPQADVAKLAVLHSFVLMNLYQVYDVFLKARQADLADPVRLPPFRRLNLLVMVALPLCFLLAGREALSLIGSPVAIGPVVAGMFGVFMACELGNLFAQSVTQVNPFIVTHLTTYAAIRTATLAAFAVAALLPDANAMRLTFLLAGLSTGSAATFLYLWTKIAHSEPSNGPIGGRGVTNQNKADPDLT
jgi:hypothetical protein